MLGQGKNPMQAEIDSAQETIDFLRFNSYFASKIYAQQPISDNSVLNRNEYRAMEGFVYAITPFNFTSIACNLNISPVLMGNVTIWKPATTAILSNYYLMKIFKEAGLPDGVINFLPGKGSVISSVAFASPHLAGIHFTGSTSTFKAFWKQIGDNIDKYNTYPKIVGVIDIRLFGVDLVQFDLAEYGVAKEYRRPADDYYNRDAYQYTSRLTHANSQLQSYAVLSNSRDRSARQLHAHTFQSHCGMKP